MMKKLKFTPIAIFVAAISMVLSLSSCSKEDGSSYAVAYHGGHSATTAALTICEYDAGNRFILDTSVVLMHGEKREFVAHPDAAKLTINVVRKDYGMPVMGGWLGADRLYDLIVIDDNTILRDNNPIDYL